MKALGSTENIGMSSFQHHMVKIRNKILFFKTNLLNLCICIKSPLIYYVKPKNFEKGILTPSLSADKLNKLLSLTGVVI